MLHLPSHSESFVVFDANVQLLDTSLLKDIQLQMSHNQVTEELYRVTNDLEPADNKVD
jgi:hypothetical protein